MAKEKQPRITIDEARAQVAAARARVAEDVRELVDDVHPKRVVQRSVDEAKAQARAELDQAASHVKDEHGWRWDRIALIGGAVAGVVTFVLVLRRLTRRR
ncbi:DUF3618 domain-containing protein [Desertihabitans brevis]|uniref:DUF3618 domain-containing protein n=1 Tax=Desertihabitans brevis TaxID=2268447 RepID=A0A367YU86_9ACTN|nr:DUF3618 domain-containing protein [Desertihabitans brevis]RCK69089.1 DUF3618 domain-containing protein [Desertihabitans brevis]